MKLNNKNIGPLKRKTRIARKPQVMVAMKLQPLLQVCIDAVEACTSAGSLPSERISIHPSVSSKIKLWLDETLFKEALVDLLEEAAKRFVRGSDIVISASSSGLHSSRLNISYIHKKTDNESNDNPFVMTYHSNDRTREIVTQHQAAINLRKDGQNAIIEVWFP